MKRLLLALALLVVLLAAGVWNAHHLGDLIGELETEVLSAQALAAEGYPGEASSQLEAARDRWERALPYLHIVIQNGDTDPIKLGFDSSLYLLRRGNADEAAGQLASLARKLALLAESEQLTLENLF